MKFRLMDYPNLNCDTCFFQNVFSSFHNTSFHKFSHLSNDFILLCLFTETACRSKCWGVAAVCKPKLVCSRQTHLEKDICVMVYRYGADGQHHTEERWRDSKHSTTRSPTGVHYQVSGSHPVVKHHLKLIQPTICHLMHCLMQATGKLINTFLSYPAVRWHQCRSCEAQLKH